VIVKGNRLEYFHEPFLPYNNKNNKLYSGKIPSSAFTKTAQYSVIAEENLNENVMIYSDIIPYLKCQIKSTIQHEAGHRNDESERNKQIQQGKNVLPFDQFTNESRAEPIAEKEEENCDSMMPPEIGGDVISVSINQLFEEAKSEASINSEYRRDVKAGALAPSAQGMYLAQDIPTTQVNPTGNPNSYEGFDGTLWVDVRKIIQPYIIHPRAYPPTTQFDGVEKDVQQIETDLNSQGPKPNSGGTASVPVVPAVPSVGAR